MTFTFEDDAGVPHCLSGEVAVPDWGVPYLDCTGSGEPVVKRGRSGMTKAHPILTESPLAPYRLTEREAALTAQALSGVFRGSYALAANATVSEKELAAVAFAKLRAGVS